MKKLFIVLTIFASACSLEDRTGPMGPEGAPGQPGSSCSVEPVSNGAVIKCDDGTSAVIVNGTDGYEFVDGDDVLGTFVCRVSELENIASLAKNYRKRLNLVVAILIVATLANIFQMSVIYKLSKVQTSVEVMNDQ